MAKKRKEKTEPPKVPVQLQLEKITDALVRITALEERLEKLIEARNKSKKMN